MRIRIGSRKSSLALAQTYIVRDKIKDAFPEAEIEIIERSTGGDEHLDRSLEAFGGKGAFTKELEEALLRGEIDMAVHSAKDLPTELPEGLHIGAVVERADARDVVVTATGVSLRAMSEGRVVGTGSLRRELQIKKINPSVQTKLIRGNVQTRLRKLQDGEYDAIILAAAGLERLGLKSGDGLFFEYLDPDDFIPAAGQGILVVESKVGGFEDVLGAINSYETELMLYAERYFLSEIGGSCNAPAAAHCTISGREARMKVMYAPLDGTAGKNTDPKIAEDGMLLWTREEEMSDITSCGSLGSPTDNFDKMTMLSGALARKVKQGKVWLIGAGPGDMGLVTGKALAVIRSADVLVYDSLSSPAVLNEARLDAELIYAGKRADRHFLRQWQINDLLIEKAKEGKDVARVKGGDPFIFGRGGEEAEKLANAGIEYEVVPGVSSCYAAPAYAGIPVTHRDYASSFHVITGHESADKNEPVLDYDTLAKEEGTLVFLMGLKNLPVISKRLIEHGKSTRTPAAVIAQGTTARQKVVTGTLKTIAADARGAGIKPPALTVIGYTAALQRHLAWFGTKPLFGTRVLLTGTPSMCAKQRTVLEREGAEVIPFSLIYTGDISKEVPDPVIDGIESYTWAVFTSSNGVEYFLKELRRKKKDVRSLCGLRFAVIGEGTRLALEEAGIYADFVPSRYSSAVLAKEWVPTLDGNDRVLILRAKEASSELARALDAAGVAHTDAALYETVRDYRKKDELNRLLCEVDYITFASASAVHAFADMAADMRKMSAKAVCIGPVTEAAAVKAGIPVYATAGVYTAEGILDVIRKDRL